MVVMGRPTAGVSTALRPCRAGGMLAQLRVSATARALPSRHTLSALFTHVLEFWRLITGVQE